MFFKSFYLFLAVLGLCGFAGFSLVVVSGGASLVAVCGLLIAMASPVVVQALVVAAAGLSSFGSQGLEHRLKGYGTQA